MKNFKRIVASLLSVLMVLSCCTALFSMIAFAEDDIITLGASYVPSHTNYWANDWTATSENPDASLTDGVKGTLNFYDIAYTAFSNGGWDSTLEIDLTLDKVYAVSGISVYSLTEPSMGVAAPNSVTAKVSMDGETWVDFVGTADKAETAAKDGWGNNVTLTKDTITADAAVNAQYIKFVLYGGNFFFLDEIEAYGAEAAADAPAYKEGLTIEIGDDVKTHRDFAATEAGLADGKWGESAEAFSDADVYLMQNLVCTDMWQNPEINFIFGYAEATTIDTVKLGLYGEYNSMVGYPANGVFLYSSNDGVEWEYVEYLSLGYEIAEGDVGTVISTMTLTESATAKYFKVVVSYPESPFEEKVIWEFMGFTEVELASLAPEYKEGLNLVYGEDVKTHRDFAATEAGLADGKWGEGAEAFSDADVYLMQNLACTDASKNPVIDFIFNYGEATKVNLIKLGLYGEYMSMVGYPAADVKISTSSNGIVWEEAAVADHGLVIEEATKATSIATIKLDKPVNAKLVKVTVNFPASPFEEKVVWEFMGFTEVELGYEAPPAINLVEGDNAVNVPVGGVEATIECDKELVLTIADNWAVTVTVNGETYWPNFMNRTLEAPLAAGKNEIVFNNDSEEAVDIVAVIGAPTIGDTMDDPIVITELGDYTANVTEKYPQGVYYKYVSTFTGELTLTINTESGWSYVINNLTAAKYGDNHWYDDDPVVSSETIAVTEGDEIAFMITTYDGSWNTPIGTVDFTLSDGEEAEPTIPVIGFDRVNHYDWTNKDYQSESYPATAASAGEVLVAVSSDARTAGEMIGGNYFTWWIKVLAEWDDEAGTFVIKEIDAPDSTVYETWTLGEGKLVFMINTGYASTEPAGNAADAEAIKALVVGDKLYLYGDYSAMLGASGALSDTYVTVNAPVGDDYWVADETPAPIVINPTVNFKYAAGETVLVPWTMGNTLDSILDKQYEWFNFAVLEWDAEAGVYKVAEVLEGTNSKADCDFGPTEIPQYGFVLGAHNDSAYHEVILQLKAGDVVYIYGENLIATEQATAIDAIVTNIAIDGKTAFAPEMAPEYKDGLNIVINDEVKTHRDFAATEAGLADGKWGESAEAFSDADVYLMMNLVCTDAAKNPAIDFVWKYAEATAIDTVKLGLYGEYNSMVGYPAKDVKIAISEDGINWTEVAVADLGVAIAEGDVGTVIATMTLAEAVTANFVKVTVNFPASPFADKVVWEFMGFTEIELSKSEDPAPSIVLGDVNGDGEVGATDYQLAKRHVLKTYTLEGNAFKAADLDGDGIIEAGEYALIKRHCLKTFDLSTLNK
ncbi:MAG: hypothetical protein IJB49_04300 [Clostridia bacterium]|nr:hypothetical protein [Clostridia bacterium]